MGMLKEFKEFAVKGNMVDMAVGIIIGAAFGGVVTSLVNDVIMPPIGLLLGHVDFSSLIITLKHPVMDAAGKNVITPAVVLSYGKFINTLINFIIVAFAVFVVIKQMNRLKRPEAPPTPSTKDCPFCKEKIALAASRCSHCTSELPA